MSEIKNQPFAYDLTSVAREASPYLATDDNRQLIRESYITPAIKSLTKDPKLFTKAQKHSRIEWNSFLSKELVRHNLGVPGAALMILDNRELISKWDESDKRDLLDAALEKENLYKQRSLARNKRGKSYYPSREKSLTSRIKKAQDDIQRNKAIQEKLRQRASPSHPATRK